MGAALGMGRRWAEGEYSLRWLLLWMMAVLFLISAGTRLHADETDCLRCHDDAKSWFKKKVKHAPFKKRQCDKCHEFHEFERKLVLKRQGQALCLECHQGVKHRLQGTIHPPVAEGQCWSCHDPHSSNEEHLLRESEGGSPCFTCHPSIQFDLYMDHPHVPFYKRECVACHAPHSSTEPFLLKQRVDLLCAECHSWTKVREKHLDYFDAPTRCTVCHRAHGSTEDKLVDPTIHPPVLDGCETCHESVRLGQTPQLVMPVSELCTGCHDEFSESPANPHPPVEEGECLACHRPHRSLETSLLRARGAPLCSECHDVEEEAAPVSSHRPFRDAECARCHDPHGSDHGALQRHALPDNCYQCHRDMAAAIESAQVVHSPVEEGACDQCHRPHSSGFRNLQVAKTRDLCGECHEVDATGSSVHRPFEGGACTACHDPHAGSPSLLKEPDGELCLKCHKDMVDLVSSDDVHPPVAEGCLTCHVSHSSEHAPLLGESQPALCGTCHGNPQEESEDHPEVDGLCTECHDAHQL